MFKNLFYALKDGSNKTRLSALIMGFGQLSRRQIAKGLFYLLSQVAFLAYMLFFGGRYIGHLFSGNLGTQLAGERWNEELQLFEKIKGAQMSLSTLKLFCRRGKTGASYGPV